MLRCGSLVKVKPIEWFIDNYDFIEYDDITVDKLNYLNHDRLYYKYYGYFESKDFHFRFIPEMQGFCNKIVTISYFTKVTSDIFSYKISEDEGYFNWSIDMFDIVIIDSKKELLYPILDYCSNYCILKDNCDNNCPFYKINRII